MPNAKDTDISIAYLRGCLGLDDAAPSGVRWETGQRAGKPAGSLGDDGYWTVTLTIGGRARPIKAHRIIYALTHGRWPKHDIDHRDQNKTANQIENLRDASDALNKQNVSMRSDNTSGIKGVSWDRRRGKWVAKMGVSGRQLHLGRFDTRDEAEAAVVLARRLLHPFAPPDERKVYIPLTITGCYKIAAQPNVTRWTFY
jgi:hypothetical protein